MKENNIKKVLLLGSGALKIGEAGEFDYSGSKIAEHITRTYGGELVGVANKNKSAACKIPGIVICISFKR